MNEDSAEESLPDSREIKPSIKHSEEKSMPRN